MQKKKENSSREAFKTYEPEQLLFDLANMQDGDGVGHFRTKWNIAYSSYQDPQLLKRRDELRYLWQLALGFQGQETEYTGGLYGHWSAYGAGPLDEQFICEYWIGEEPSGWEVRWTDEKKDIRPRLVSLPTALAWASVVCADRLAFCMNPKCPASYFLAKRRDQKYCSNICATPAKRAAKLKWWHEHRGKKSQSKKSRK